MPCFHIGMERPPGGGRRADTEVNSWEGDNV